MEDGSNIIILHFGRNTLYVVQDTSIPLCMISQGSPLCTTYLFQSYPEVLITVAVKWV